MTSNKALVMWAVVLVVMLGLAAWWVFAQPGALAPGGPAAPRYQTISNPALDVRYEYNSTLLTPVPFDERMEFPLKLDGRGWGFYGKRIKGMGKWFDHTGPELYDLLGVFATEAFEEHDNLRLVGDPVHADYRFNGILGLHQSLVFESKGGNSWPNYFPADFRDGNLSQNRVYIEGWSLLTEEDIFFFYAISKDPLTAGQIKTCEDILASLEFNAIIGDLEAGRGEQDGEAAVEEGTEAGEPVSPEETEVETEAVEPEESVESGQ